MVKKVVITGPESTGKSTLTKNLAKYFDSIFVDEFAREYLNNLNRKYTSFDVEFIAQQQILQEKETALKSPEIIFCDTATLVPKVWYEFKYGRTSKIIDDLWNSQVYDLWLLCNTETPWEPDPLRENPNHRNELFERFEQHLSTKSTPVEIIRGNSKEERFHQAVKAVKKFLS